DWAKEEYNGGCPVNVMVPGMLTFYLPSLRTPCGSLKANGGLATARLHDSVKQSWRRFLVERGRREEIGVSSAGFEEPAHAQTSSFCFVCCLLKLGGIQNPTKPALICQ
ncbi:probable flavin-containing monoamine oxidase A isoform X1, partial [Tachysurus ichikawai]